MEPFFSVLWFIPMEQVPCYEEMLSKWAILIYFWE
jgi:hypothetical protein